MVEVVQSNDLFLQEENGPVLELNKEDYDFRINLLVQRIQQKTQNIPAVDTFGYTEAQDFGEISRERESCKRIPESVKNM